MMGGTMLLHNMTLMMRDRLISVDGGHSAPYINQHVMV